MKQRIWIKYKFACHIIYFLSWNTFEILFLSSVRFHPFLPINIFCNLDKQSKISDNADHKSWTISQDTPLTMKQDLITVHKYKKLLYRNFHIFSKIEFHELFVAKLYSTIINTHFTQFHKSAVTFIHSSQAFLPISTFFHITYHDVYTATSQLNRACTVQGYTSPYTSQAYLL